MFTVNRFWSWLLHEQFFSCCWLSAHFIIPEEYSLLQSENCGNGLTSWKRLSEFSQISSHSSHFWNYIKFLHDTGWLQLRVTCLKLHSTWQWPESCSLSCTSRFIGSTLCSWPKFRLSKEEKESFTVVLTACLPSTAVIINSCWCKWRGMSGLCYLDLLL
jgi:hypothetical protein